jgi:hypothetical protein
MNSKLATAMLALLFTAAVAWSAHAGEACCGAAAAADKAGVEKPSGDAAAPCQHGEEAGCAGCAKCADCPDCAAGKPCAEGKCEKCDHCAKGEACANCPGPDKCPHHENCPNACTGCAAPEGGEAK